jgi:hypothetical protein
MIILRIEHAVSSFEGWKRAFDSDPINRQNSGVKHYTIYRPADDPNYVVIDLDFDNMEQAQATLTALRNMMTKVEGTLILAPKTSILNVVEEKAY